MLSKYIIKYLKNETLKNGKYAGLWRRFGKPSLEDWSEYLRLHGGFQSMGLNCAINPSVTFTDPHMTAIGSNVRIAGGLVMCHDGSVNMLNRAYECKLDAVGPVILADNVFIGVGCIVLPGTRIGPNTIIGAGSVVTGRIEGSGVYAGNPLRYIRSINEHVSVLEKRNAGYPWREIIKVRQAGYDATVEPRLRRMRIKHFFESASTSEQELPRNL